MEAPVSPLVEQGRGVTYWSRIGPCLAIHYFSVRGTA